MSSPCFSIIYNFPHDDISQTPRQFVTPICKVTKRRPKKSTPPIAVIDLTNTPSPAEHSPPTHDHSYHSFATELNSHRDYRRSTSQHAGLKYSDVAKYSLSADTYYSAWTPKLVASARSPRVVNSARARSIKKEKQDGTPHNRALEESPFTPKNQVQWRPLRGYRLQDVLHVKPITPINYYKRTSSFCHDSS